MIETTPIEPNLNETDKPDVEMNTYDITTPDKNKVTPKRTSKKSKTISIDFGEDALQTENLEPQIELVKKPKAKPKARSGAKRKSKETIIEREVIDIDLDKGTLQTEPDIVEMPKAKPKARSGAKHKSKETIIEREVIDIDLDKGTLQTEPDIVEMPNVKDDTVVVSPTNTSPNNATCETPEISSVKTTVACPNCFKVMAPKTLKYNHKYTCPARDKTEPMKDDKPKQMDKVPDIVLTDKILEKAIENKIKQIKSTREQRKKDMFKTLVKQAI